MQRLIKDFNKDEILLNVFYEYGDDSLLTVSKNIKNGNKIMREYKEPKVPVYINNSERGSGVTSKYREFVDKKVLEKHWVSYRWRVFELARLIGIRDFAKRLKNKELKANHVQLDKKLFSTDVHIEDLVMREYFKYNLNTDVKGDLVIDFPIIDKFHLSGLDIETDINVADEPRLQPVILNTVVDDKSWKIVTRGLINKEYKGQEDIVNNPQEFKDFFIKSLTDHINNIDVDEDDPEEKIKKENKIKKMILDLVNKLDLDIKFTNDEKEVISEPIKFLFNETNPDFCYIYNAVYDINHMKLRSEVLGLDFDSLFQYKDNKVYNSFIYNSQDPDPKQREHYYNSHNPTKIIDQLLQYAQLRRGTQLASYSLANVSKREIGISKLDYSKICSYIGDFPYVDYKTFVVYNIIDVFIMMILDRFTNDTYSQVYSRFTLCTEWGRLSKPLRRTTNVFDTLCEVQGYIPGNELNSIFLSLDKKRLKIIEERDPDLIKIINQLKEANVGEDEENPYCIEGGCVANPNKLDDSIKGNEIYSVDIHGYNKLKNCADLDAKAMYPSNTEVNNGSKTTLVGVMKDTTCKDKDNISRRLALSLLNENFSSLGYNFFHLPQVEDIIRNYYNIQPIYKNRIDYPENVINDDIYDCKELDSNLVKNVNNLFGKYRTKYDAKDVEAGNPSRSTYIFLSDDNEVKFSHYNTEVTIRLKNKDNNIISINEYLGCPDAGFLMGTLLIKDMIISNNNDEYFAYKKPKNNEPELSNHFVEKIFTKNELCNIFIDSIHSKKLVVEDYTITTLGRLFFISFKDPKLYDEIKIRIYDLIKDQNLAQLIMFLKVDMGDGVVAEVEQRVVFYKS